MVRFAVAVVVAFVLLSTTVVSAAEPKAPPTAADVQAMIQQTDQLIAGLQKKLEELNVRKIRLQGALNYAQMSEAYDATAGTCEEGDSCGQAQAEDKTSADSPNGNAD